MAWERRRNGHMFYYRAERVGDRIVKQYVGGGEKGRLAAAADQAVRDSHAQAVQLHTPDRRPRWISYVALLDEFGELVDLLIPCQLLCSG